MARVSHKRHIAKAITWRIIGSLDTMLIAWVISGDSRTGLTIGLVETATKLLLYYLHERLWYRGNVKDANKRHIYKTFSWRIVGTLDTVIISWVITGNPLMGLSIGLVEVLTKMLLYYIHERMWYKIDFGIKKEEKTG